MAKVDKNSSVLDQLISKSKTKATAKKKSTVPEYTFEKYCEVNKFDVSSPKKEKEIRDQYETLLKEAIETNRAFKDAESNWNISKEPIVDIARKIYDSTEGDPNSMKLTGDAGRVLISFKDQFKKIDDETASKLEETLGENFGNFFAKRLSISSQDGVDGREVIQTIIDCFNLKYGKGDKDGNGGGQEKFLQLFDIVETVEPVKELDIKQYKMPSEARELISQYAPAVRVS